MTLKTLRTWTLAVAAVGALTLTGTALAAHPKSAKKYGGSTSAAKLNGFAPKVTFKTSKDTKKLFNFTYQSTGCYGSGGQLTPGVNYLTKPWNLHDLGTIAVSSKGTFSRKNVTTTYTSGAQRTATTSSVTGHFKNASTAVGTITFTQTVFQKSGPQIKPCGPAKITFTAKAASSSGGGISGGY
jgi:hypothetical protein